jgi:hypothetical protein
MLKYKIQYTTFLFTSIVVLMNKCYREQSLLDIRHIVLVFLYADRGVLNSTN